MIDQFNEKTKAAVTVAEMARMLNLSRQRLHQLIGTAFPYPGLRHKNSATFLHRGTPKGLPRSAASELRRRWEGNTFLCPAWRRSSSPIKETKKAKPNLAHVAILDAVKSLGLVSATADQVGSAIKILFPRGVESVDQAEVIRGVFVHLQRQNRSDNVGR